MAETTAVLKARLQTATDVDNTGPKLTRADGLAIVDTLIDVETTSTAGDVRAIGGMYVSSAAATTIVTVNVYAKVAGTTAALPGVTLVETTAAATNRVAYTGDTARTGLLTLSFSLVGAVAASKDFTVSLHKNGSPIVGAEMTVLSATTTDVHAGALSIVEDIVEDDYFEVFVKNTTDDENVTLESMQLTLVGF